MLASAPSISSLEFGGGGFVYAIEQAHLPGLIVSAILLALSVVSWSVMFTKMGMVRKIRKNNERFLEAFRNAHTVLGPWEANISLPASPLYLLYRSACRELGYHLLGSTEPDESFNSQVMTADKLTPPQMESVRASMERSIGESTVHLESRMTFLATAVSGAPFLGLLGTVWGVMETFSGVASAGSSASIQSMAPGVSAALVTTVIALLVAIPAMFGYNFLIQRIRTLLMEMHNFAAEISTLFDRSYVDFQPSGSASRAPSLSEMGPPVRPKQDEVRFSRPSRPEPQPEPEPEAESFYPSGQEPPVNPIAQASSKMRADRPPNPES